ncbi:MAG TPA: hypothetical protein VFY69_04405 [Solirubrobacterales bacterium]|nr:hypothetical protein [Solirubrobacterales bacterium]
MSWLERLRGRRRREHPEPSIPRTPFVLIERRNLSPASSALLAELARRYTLIPVTRGPRHSLRVGVKDAGSESEAMERLSTVMAELDPAWEEHFTRPTPSTGR